MKGHAEIVLGLKIHYMKGFEKYSGRAWFHQFTPPGSASGSVRDTGNRPNILILMDTRPSSPTGSWDFKEPPPDLYLKEANEIYDLLDVPEDKKYERTNCFGIILRR